MHFKILYSLLLCCASVQVYAQQADTLPQKNLSKSWLHRKLFTEHLLQIDAEDYQIYADFLPDFTIGREFFSDRNTWLNTRGYQVGGKVLDKFSFYTSGFENQGRFAGYYDRFVNETGVVPGQSYNRGNDKFVIPETKDWSYVTAVVSYTPSKHLNITLGHDKNFIGEGHRSLLLSDVASPYTFLKLTGKLGNVEYMAMWAGMQDPSAKKLSEYTGNRKKGAAFHYLSWQVNKRLSLGFFDAVVWSRTDDEGNRRGLDVDYLNPIVFLRPLEAGSGSPDNAVLGFNGKYAFSETLTAYGQFVLDDFVAEHFFSGDGFFRNKSGFQLGIKGNIALQSNKLVYRAEFNSVRPFTYSEKTLSIINYAHYNQPLAHPMGANFREAIGMFSYQTGRFSAGLQGNYARYGYDVNGINYGKDIFNLYEVNSMERGNYIGQGLKTDFYYGEMKLSWMINPSYNLRIEWSGIYRHEKNDLINEKTYWTMFGIRSSFRKLYTDF